ncbi:FAD binding domain-containing protein, partial [Pseudomonas sp. UBA800]
MTPFSYHKPASITDAVNLADPASRFIAGGTNLVDLMKENIVRPERLIDITGLGLNTVEQTPNGGLLIGALVSNADLAWHPLIEQGYPLLSQAILAGASPQLRNMASTGGNLLQRT